MYDFFSELSQDVFFKTQGTNKEKNVLLLQFISLFIEKKENGDNNHMLKFVSTLLCD